MQILKIGNGWLAGTSDGNLANMFYYGSLNAIEAAMKQPVAMPGAKVGATEPAAPANDPVADPAPTPAPAEVPNLGITELEAARAASAKRRGRPPSKPTPQPEVGNTGSGGPAEQPATLSGAAQPGAAAPTKEQVSGVMSEFLAKFGIGPMQKILAKYNAKMLSNLKPEQYTAFVAEVREALAKGV